MKGKVTWRSRLVARLLGGSHVETHIDGVTEKVQHLITLKDGSQLVTEWCNPSYVYVVG